MPVSTCLECGAVLEERSLYCGQCGREQLAASLGPDDPWIGRVVDRRYRVMELLGTGGMGMVYRVEHLHLGKDAAMKVLRPGSADDPDAVRRFRLEAQAVSRLNHPNIVQTFDFGLWEGALYLVMEHVRGHDLATVVARQGPMPAARALPLFIQTCSALTEAHEQGIIHRDVKPENLMVVRRRDGSEHVKVLDFGLAKLRESSGPAQAITGQHVIGTPDYMSPEQIRSEPLDVRADVYALGASLYRVLTGTAPFSASSAVEVLAKHILDPVEPLGRRRPDLHIPEAVGSIVERAMAKAREDRQGSAAEVQRALQTALDGLRGDEIEPGVGWLPDLGRPGRPSRAWTVEVEPSRGAAAPQGERERRRALEADPEADIGPAYESSTVRERDAESEHGRLRRSEFDAFEQSLRRRRWFWLAAAPLLLLTTVWLAFWQLGRGRERIATIEREPNDTPASATLLHSDAPIQGHIGRKTATGQPDLDYFQVPAGKGRRAVSARLEGIPGADLVLELFDASGSLLAKSDSRGLGGGEWIQPTVIGPAEAYLLVRQLWVQGDPVLEDVADAFRLTARWAPLDPNWESEPNDRPEQATPAVIAVPMDGSVNMKGYLGTAADRDWFEFRAAAAGTMVASVIAGEGVAVDLETETDTQAPVGPRRKPAAAPTRQRAATDDLRMNVEAGRVIRLAVVRRQRESLGPKAPENTVGLDSPYELTVKLSGFAAARPLAAPPALPLR